MERSQGGSNSGGFDFELVKRNAMLAAKGMKPPSAWKTGTTIAGVIFKVGGGGAGGSRMSDWRLCPMHLPALSHLSALRRDEVMSGGVSRLHHCI